METKSTYERDMQKFKSLEGKFEQMEPGYTQSKEHLRVRRDFYDHMRTKHGKKAGEDQWLEQRMMKGARNHVNKQITKGWIPRNSKGLGRSTGSFLWNTGKILVLAPILIVTAIGALLARGERAIISPAGASSRQRMAAFNNSKSALSKGNDQKSKSPAMRTVHKAVENAQTNTQQVLKKIPQRRRTFQAAAKARGMSR